MCLPNSPMQRFLHVYTSIVSNFMHEGHVIKLTYQAFFRLCLKLIKTEIAFPLGLL